MKKEIYFMLCLFSLTTHAQPFTKVLDETKSVTIKSATVLRNGDLVIACNLDNDYIFVRTDAKGNFLWSQSEGNNDVHNINKVIATIDSGYVACGSLGNKGYFAKFSKTNSIAFEKSFPFIGTQKCEAFDIAQTGLTAYRMVGVAVNDTYSTQNIPYMVLNETGGGTLGTCAQIYQNDITGYPVSAKRMLLDGSSVPTYFLFGGNITISSTRKGILLTKYNFSPAPPSFGYTKQILGPATGKQLEFQDMAGTKDLSVFAIAGNIDNSSSLTTDGKGVVFYLKNDGSIQWAKQLADVFIYQIIMNEDKTVSVLGNLRGSSLSFFAKISETGTILNQHTFATTKGLTPSYSQLLKNDTGYYAIGVTTFSGTPTGKIVISSLSSSGKTACSEGKLTLSISNFTYTTPQEFLAYYTKNIAPQSITYDGGTPYNPTTDFVCGTQTSVEDLLADNTFAIKCYPNPANQQVNVLVSTANKFLLKIFNSSGQLVYDKECFSEHVIADISQWSSGLYTASVQMQGSSFSKRFLID